MVWAGPAFLLAGAALVFSCTKASEDKLIAGGTPCDTVGMKYTENVVPVLQNNCYGCHGTGNTAGSGGILLQGYTNIKIYANNGYLVGNITHAPGYHPMPNGGSPMSTCDINIIVDWVNSGAPNN